MTVSKAGDSCRLGAPIRRNGTERQPARNSSWAGQINYKRELFAIFAEAYRAGLCTGPGQH